MHHGLLTLPATPFPQPPPGQPAELGQHGHREAQDCRRRGGGHAAADELLLAPVAGGHRQPAPGGGLPEGPGLGLLHPRQQGDQHAPDPKRSGRQAAAVHGRGARAEGQAQAEQEQPSQQPNQSGRPVCLKRSKTGWLAAAEQAQDRR